MKCDLCNQEFANSEEVKQHKEQVHPMGDGKDPDLQAPAIVQNPGMKDGMERNDSEMPEPAEKRNR
jgi:hypothetical protein